MAPDRPTSGLTEVWGVSKLELLVDEGAPPRGDGGFAYPFDPYAPVPNACLSAAGFFYYIFGE